MSAITTSSGSTCHQEYGPMREHLRRCWNICWTHLQMLSISTVLGEKTSDVGQSWGAGANLPGRRPPTHWIRRGLLNEVVMFGELRIFPFVSFRSVHVSMGMDVWVNVCLYDAILLRSLWIVEKYFWGASAKLPGRRPLRHWTSERRRHVWWVEDFTLRLF